MFIVNNNIQNNNFSFRAKPISRAVASNIYSKISDPSIKTVDIYTHVLPDEDTLNSAKVMYNFLQSLGKKVRICTEEKETKGLFFSPNYKLKQTDKEPDMHLIVDFNSTERFPQKSLLQFNKSPQKPTVILDHHNIQPNTLETNSQKDGLYVDETAKSCSGVIFRFFETLGQKIEKTDAKNLYCGMLSDYSKSKLVSIENTPTGAKLIKLPELENDKNSKEVLEKLEAQLDKDSKQEVYNHLDIFAKLNAKEKKFMNDLPQKIKISPNGKLAYIVIKPDSKIWASIGMDTVHSSKILSSLRTRIINNPEKDNVFSPELKEKLKNVQAAMVFYKIAPNSNKYKISIHSKKESINAKDFIDKSKIEWDKYLTQSGKSIEYQGGGHSDRAGGGILSCDKEDINAYINCFIKTVEQNN